MRAGYELRHQRWQIDNAAYGAGASTSTARTRARTTPRALNDPGAVVGAVPSRTADHRHNTVATPGSTASQFEIAADADYRQASHALFVQDDWHSTRS